LYSALPKEIKTEVRKGREKKRMKAKLGAIFLVSVLAIAGCGAAYALWYEDLVIWTDIDTGDVNVEWSYDGWDCDQTKEISYIEAYIGDWDDDLDNFLQVYIYDAYPCVNYYVYFNIECTGSIPVHFTPFTIETNLPADSYDFDVTSNSGVPLDEVQLHNGDVMWFTLRIHFNNNIEENTGYTFDLYTMAHQYNEVP
jgi:hypothetical protein